MDINPEKQNIDSVFNSTAYLIDFYQRDYKWNETHIKPLLEDIFYKFDQDYYSNRSLDPSSNVITTKYSWYYLSTYVTNVSEGHTYIVDGQQRLTTITLCLIKLFHLTDKENSKLKGWLSQKIMNNVGYEKAFFIGHEKRKKILEILFENKPYKLSDFENDISASNMLNNYVFIAKWFDKELSDIHRLDTFIFYMLLRIVIINLDVSKTDVPMVFEVINDRGEKLKPYEILKGKILGQIDKIELEDHKFNELWEEQIKKLRYFGDSEIDEFFRTYLKARFSTSRADGQKFDGDYHKVMFTDDMQQLLPLKRNPIGVKSYLLNDFKYYSNLYIKIRQLSLARDKQIPFVFFNSLTEMNSQYLAIMAGCELNDVEEFEKATLISYHIDKMYILLRLQRAYDSNRFQDLIYEINQDIRKSNKEVISEIFDKHLLNELSVQKGSITNEVFSYAYFKDVGYDLPPRFIRYFFARINLFIYDNINKIMPFGIGDIVTKTGAKNGFHVEHILSHNKENLKKFKNDEDLFERERSRFGGILILKGLDNISSGNETYKQKLKTYASTIIWNESLREDTYKSKLDVKKFKKDYNLDLKAYNDFGPSELEDRHKLLFEIVKIIWK